MKTEREKMLSGEFYNPADPELFSMAKEGRALLRKLHQAVWDDSDYKYELLQKLLGKLGKNVWIEPPFFCDYGNNIYIDDDSYVNANCVFLDCAEIHIGKGVLIAPAVQLYAVTHPVDSKIRMAGNNDYGKPITIGDHAWIGGGSIVLPGVNIGAGTTIGAGSVVTKDVPANVLAYGNPCRVIKNI